MPPRDPHAGNRRSSSAAFAPSSRGSTARSTRRAQSVGSVSPADVSGHSRNLGSSPIGCGISFGGSSGSKAPAFAADSPALMWKSANQRDIDARDAGTPHLYKKGSGSRSTARMQDAHEAPWIFRVSKVINFLVQEPLQQLYASIRRGFDLDAEPAPTDNLSPITEFLERTLSALQGVQDALHCQDTFGSKRALWIMLELQLGRQQELMLGAQLAGKAICGLADIALHSVNARLRTLQDNLGQALDGVRLQWRREDARRQERDSEFEIHRQAEVSELRRELCEAKGRVDGLLEQSAAERRQWGCELEELAKVYMQEQGVADRSRWENVASEMGQFAEHRDCVRQLSEVWASQTAQRDRELRILRERADAAVIELRCSEDSAEAQRVCSLAEHRHLELAREHTVRELAQERTQLASMAVAVARVKDAEEQVVSRLFGELGQERRERASLSLQLNEAMGSIASKGHEIERLRRSLSEELERTRQPPIAAVVPLPPSRINGMPVSNNHSVHGIPPPIPPFPNTVAVPGTPDGTSSVCRISTESTTFASQAVAALPPKQLDRENIAVGPEPASSVDPLDQSRHQVFGTAPSVWAPTVSFSSNAKDPHPTASMSNAKGSPSSRMGTETREVSADRIRQGENAERPWELPPQEFLARWRRSRASVLSDFSRNGTTCSGASLRSVSQVHDLNVPPNSETLRITTNFQ